MKTIIETHALSKYYGKHRGIESIDLKVEEGDFFGFIGPNGAGKSTTIRILLGLLKKSSGSGKVFGREVGPNQLEILKSIGYMPSEAIFYPNLKGEEVVKFSAKLHGTYSENKVDRLAKQFDLDLTKKVKDLSLGNRKKISILCALQHHPPLYIFDEPTSGLDPLMQQIFWEEIMRRNGEGATIFVSSHVLSEVQKYCHTAAIIRQGQIIAQAPMKDLIATSMKQVHILGVNQVDLPGMSKVQRDDQSISFMYQGPIASLISQLQDQQDKIIDLSINQPDIETIFMHYYQKDAGDE